MIAIVNESLMGKILDCDNHFNLTISSESDENGVPITHQVHVDEANQLIGPTIGLHILQEYRSLLGYIFNEDLLDELISEGKYGFFNEKIEKLELHWILNEGRIYPLDDNTEKLIELMLQLCK